MPIFFQQEINESTRLAIWKIAEDETFFDVPLQREITHPHKRLQHLAGRFLLTYLYPDFPVDLIKIADTRKPYLQDEAYHFSISHCSNYAAAIVSKNKRVGVDIEVPTQRVEKIKDKFLHKEELAVVSEESLRMQDSPKRQTPNAKLTLLWSAKEAVFKWWSYGGVDFSEMIRLQAFTLQEEGEIKAQFLSSQKQYDLQLHYRIFENLCLAWIKY